MFINDVSDKDFPQDAIEIKSTGRISFSTNRLSYGEIDAIKDMVAKLYPNYRFPNENRRVSLFYNTNPHYQSPEAIEDKKKIYDQLSSIPNINFTTYGTVSVRVDFGKLIGEGIDINDAEFGVIFIGDSYSMKNKTRGAVRYGYNHLDIEACRTIRNIEPLSDSEYTLNATFDRKATVIIYVVDGYVEKRENEFWPSIRVIRVPLYLFQNEKEPSVMYSRIQARFTHFSYTVVEDFVSFILRPVVRELRSFKHRDQMAFDLVKAFGFQPRDYYEVIRGDDPTHEKKVDDETLIEEKDRRSTGKKSKSKSRKRSKGVDYVADTLKREQEEFAQKQQKGQEEFAQEQPAATPDESQEQPEATLDESQEEAEGVSDESQEQPEATLDESQEEAEGVSDESQEQPEATLDESQEEAEGVSDESQEQPEATLDESQEEAEGVSDESQEQPEATLDESQEEAEGVSDGEEIEIDENAG